MISQQVLVCDNSTLANFKAWAQAISGFFSTTGWTRSTDTGQVNWSTYATVPSASGIYAFEIWEPSDGLTTFYVKVEYGNLSSSALNPYIQFSISQTTNGAGTLTGPVLGPLQTAASYNNLGPTAAYDCRFSGAAGRIAAMLWRDAPNSGGTFAQQFFAIERSLNASGAYTSDHVTLVVAGWQGGGGSANVVQQSLVFGIGVAPAGWQTNRAAPAQGLYVRAVPTNGSAGASVSSGFNNSIPFDTTAPMVGFFDYPLTSVGASLGVDIVEGVTFGATVYGATRTYLPSKNGAFAYCAPAFCLSGAFTGAMCMRFD
jgi:hypothetical protein